MVLDALRRPRKRNSVSIGIPEAEAEAVPTASVSLLEVYEDHHDLAGQISEEKFLVVGRKGAGKSAFAEYVCATAKQSPNLFAEFIRGSDCNFEKLVHSSLESEGVGSSEAIFRWLVYTNLLRLALGNESLPERKEYNLLRQFLRKNSGYVEINQYELDQLIEKRGWTIETESLRRAFRARKGRDLEFRQNQAPFYKLLPHLEETLVSLLRDERELSNENSYLLFFDDLDVGFHSSREESSEALISLVRACRHINNEVFGKNQIRAKVVVLIRDDIESFLATKYADSAKMFSSYAARITWYQDEYASQSDERNLLIRRMIDKRIVKAFQKSAIQVDESDPWTSLVREDASNRSTFKSVLNETLFRPRDLILFFLPLSNGAYTYPLGRSELNSLKAQYAEELGKEVKSELSSFIENDQVELLCTALGTLVGKPTSYTDAIQAVRTGTMLEPGPTLSYLFGRSVIGNVDEKNWYTFRCRQTANAPKPIELDPSQGVVVQYGFASYLRRHYTRSA